MIWRESAPRASQRSTMTCPLRLIGGRTMRPQRCALASATAFAKGLSYASVCSSSSSTSASASSSSSSSNSTRTLSSRDIVATTSSTSREKRMFFSIARRSAISSASIPTSSSSSSSSSVSSTKNSFDAILTARSLFSRFPRKRLSLRSTTYENRSSWCCAPFPRGNIWRCISERFTRWLK